MFALALNSTAPASATEVPPAIASLKVLNVSCGPGSLTELQKIKAEKLLAQANVVPSEAPAATPAPTAVPTASPTYPPIAPLPGIGAPGILVPPPPSPNIPTPPPLPTSTPPGAAPSGPVPLIQATGTPNVTATAKPAASALPAASPVATLGPNQYAVLADRIEGGTKPGEPSDAIGNVNVFYVDGQIVGDRAHYDGTRYIDITGQHVYLRNRSGDTVLFADSIRFDTVTQKAYLKNGHGATLQGVERGALHFTAQNLQTDRYGVATGDHATFTTCDNPRGGYHIESKTLDLIPDDRLIARAVTLFLGGMAIFFIPLLVIPLRHTEESERRPTSFLPHFGYSQSQGFYEESQIQFGVTNTYYGYYRLNYYTKVGLGLGYVAWFSRKNGRRNAHVDFYRMANKQTAYQNASLNYNLETDETEYYSYKLNSKVQFQYQGNYGPGISAPPNETWQATINHTGTRESQSYSLSRFTSGSQQSTLNVGFTDQHQITNRLSNGINLTYNDSLNSYASGGGTATGSFQFNTLTTYTSPGINYQMNFNKTISNTPFGLEKLPEITVKPNAIFPLEKLVPITANFTLGEYSEPSTPLATQRAQAQANFGPALFKVFHSSDFSASFSAQQDYYGTGDLKALLTQNMSLTTPFGPHIYNAITYNESNSNGPLAEPFKTFDILGGDSHGAQDVLRIYNGSVWNLSLTDGTNFNRSAQPVQYAFTARPSYRSAVSIGGAWTPGSGNGFDRSAVLFSTPFGRGSDIQFATNVDWKNKGRLEDKVLFYRRTIGDCYLITVGYNQDLKQVNVAVSLTAFPSQSAGFGFGGQQQSIIPQSLAF